MKKEFSYFCLTQDNDSHWYVIPAEKSYQWSTYLDKEVIPEWAEKVGGGPALVVFPSYKIL